MPNVISSVQPSDWLKSEEGSDYSRDQVIIASGAGVLKSGTVLGKITASGKYVTQTNGASDGSQTAAAILLFGVDATSADQRAAVIARDAIVMHQGLTRGADVNDSTKRAAANASLAAVGILVREGA